MADVNKLMLWLGFTAMCLGLFMAVLIRHGSDAEHRKASRVEEHV